MLTGGAGWRGATRLVHVERIIARNFVRRNLANFHSCSPFPKRQGETSRFKWVRTIVLEENLHGCNGVRLDDFPIEGLRVEHGRLPSRVARGMERQFRLDSDRLLVLSVRRR